MIRPAERIDVPAILEIENSSFSDPWEESLFLEALSSENKHVFVDEIFGSIVGYVVFELVHDEGHITDLAVAKENHGKGIASGLVEHVLGLATSLKAKEVFLEVRQGNEAAKGLYSGFGFKEIGVRKGYYPKANEDALVLSLKLK